MGGIEVPDEKAAELPHDEFETLTETIESIIERARRIGVTVHADVMNGNSHNGRLQVSSDVPVFGASLGKLPLAAVLIRHRPFSAMKSFSVGSEVIDTTGGGDYDHPDAPRVAITAELLDDMLRNSGNTAYRILAPSVGNADTLNYLYEENGWSSTRTHQAKNGRIILGETTPTDVIDQLRMLLEHNAYGGDEELQIIAASALENNEVSKHGIRQRVKPQTGIRIFNKTGEYPGDETDDRAYRHDAGLVEGKGGNVWYSVMTTSSKVGRGLLADGIVAQITAEVASAVGARDIRSLGATMLHRLM